MCMATLVSLGPSKLDAASLAQKQEKLFSVLAGMGRVLVAYSGGTDSAYLAWASNRALGDNAVAITADSASLPESHKTDAEVFARDHGIRHEYIETREFDNPAYVANNPDRCFHCKDELFTRLAAAAAERGIAHVIYGVNVDDLGDYRPGQGAAKLHGVKAPLVDAGLTKSEIRALSQRAGLATWDRPASACLSSRIPYGTPVTIQNVKTVDRGEEAIREAEKLNLVDNQFYFALLGELYTYKSRIPEAIAEFQKELAINPANAATYYKLADAYSRVQKYDDAQRLLQRSIWLDATSTGPFILMGKVLEKKGEFELAVRALQRAASMDPNSAMTHHLLGQTYRDMGKKEEAESELKLAEELQKKQDSHP